MQAFGSVNVCFFGLNRSLSATIDSINNYLFDSLDELNIDYSIFGSFVRVDSFSNERSHEFDAKPQENESELIDFVSLKYVDQGAVDDLIRWDLVFRFGDTYGQINEKSDLGKSSSTTKNIFRSLFSLKSSFGLIPPSLLNRPTIFVRPDLEILSKIDFKFYLSLLSKHSASYAYGKSDGVAIFPNWHSWDGLNDRFAMASPGNAASTYANRFDSLFPYLEISRHPLHPELFLQQIMRASRIEALPILPVHMARIRSDGNPQAENFLMGQRGFDPESRALSSLHKIIEDRGAESDGLRNKLNELDGEKEKYQSQVIASQEEIARQEELMKSIIAEKEKYQSQVIASQEEIARQEELIKSMIAEKEKYQSQIVASQEEMARQEEKLNLISAEKSELSQLLASKEMDFEQVKKSLAAEADCRKSLSAQCEVALKDVENAKNEVKSLKLQFLSRSEELEDSLKVNADQLDQLKGLQAKYSILSNNNQRYELEIEGLQKELVEINAELDRERAELRAGVERMQQLQIVMAQLKDDRDLQIAEKQLAQSSVQSLNKQLDERRQCVTSMEASTEILIRQLHQVQSELEEYFLLSREQSTLLEQNSTLQDRIAGLCTRVMQD